MTKFKLAVSINVMSNANIVKWHICSHFNITEIDGGFYTTSQQKEAKEDLTAMYNDLVEKGLLTKENKREIRRLVSEHYWNN